MDNSQWQWIIQALIIVSKQLHHQQTVLNHLSEHLGATLPSQLIEAGKDLSEKTQALQAVLGAQQAETTTTTNPKGN